MKTIMKTFLLLSLCCVGCVGKPMPLLESVIDSPSPITIRAVPGSVANGYILTTSHVPPLVHFFVLASDRNIDNETSPARQRVTLVLPPGGGGFIEGQGGMLYRDLDAAGGPVNCSNISGHADWNSDDVIAFEGVCNDSGIRISGRMWGTLVTEERLSH